MHFRGRQPGCWPILATAKRVFSTLNRAQALFGVLFSLTCNIYWLGRIWSKPKKGKERNHLRFCSPKTSGHLLAFLFPEFFQVGRGRPQHGLLPPSAFCDSRTCPLGRKCFHGGAVILPNLPRPHCWVFRMSPNVVSPKSKSHRHFIPRGIFFFSFFWTAFRILP